MAKDGPNLGKRPFYLPLGRNDECIGGIENILCHHVVKLFKWLYII